MAIPAAKPDDGEQGLLQADRAVFATGSPAALKDNLLDPNFTWTDSSGNTQSKSEILQAIRSGENMSIQAGILKAHDYGQVGIVQENSGKVFVLRIWIKKKSGWRLLINHAVTSGAPSSSEPVKGTCENPCNTVPFQPRTEEEREVIRAYQSVERAVTANDSAAWGSHIANEFFAVTSNSDRPLDKVTRMAGLDNQKVAGIAPFPLMSARMFKFGDAMVMTSRQQPEHGLPLHVPRVWFKRNGVWLEAYSYQTTIQSAPASR
jgi:hypothetical protein